MWCWIVSVMTSTPMKRLRWRMCLIRCRKCHPRQNERTAAHRFRGVKEVTVMTLKHPIKLASLPIPSIGVDAVLNRSNLPWTDTKPSCIDSKPWVVPLVFGVSNSKSRSHVDCNCERSALLGSCYPQMAGDLLNPLASNTFALLP
jgi:hypothetical protein